MLTLWNDLERALWRDPFRTMTQRGTGFEDEMRRMEQMFGALRGQNRDLWGRANVLDRGDHLLFVAEIPGVRETDIDLTVQNDVLSVRANRVMDAPGDARVFLQERPPYEFCRSVSLPRSIDSEKTKANISNGVLHVQMAVAADQKPRRIKVKA